jgi:hypothetical protein
MGRQGARGSKQTGGGANPNKQDTDTQRARTRKQSNRERDHQASTRTDTHTHARTRTRTASRTGTPPAERPDCCCLAGCFPRARLQTGALGPKAPATGPQGRTGDPGSHQGGGGGEGERGRRGKKDAGEERASAERTEDHLGIPSLQYTTILLPGMPNHLRAVFRRKKQTPGPHERSGFIRWSPPVLKSKRHELAT